MTRSLHPVATIDSSILASQERETMTAPQTFAIGVLSANLASTSKRSATTNASDCWPSRFVRRADIDSIGWPISSDWPSFVEPETSGFHSTMFAACSTWQTVSRGPVAASGDIAATHLADVRSKLGDLHRMERVLADLVSACADGTLPACPLLESLAHAPHNVS